jgi:ABC-type molybdenum transport system ATPase subunit/photorepair protein PhrA
MKSETTHRESSRGDPSVAPFLEADQVRVEYGKLVAVRDLSFSLASGDVLGLIGPNGAGKASSIGTLISIWIGWPIPHWPGLTIQAAVALFAQVLGRRFIRMEQLRRRAEKENAPSDPSPPAHATTPPRNQISYQFTREFTA